MVNKNENIIIVFQNYLQNIINPLKEIYFCAMDSGIILKHNTISSIILKQILIYPYSVKKLSISTKKESK